MIKLEKMVESDYDCYAGVDIDKDYFPDAFINWEVPFNHFAAKTAVVILDASGIGIDIYHDDDDGEVAISWYKESQLDKAIDWLKNAPETLDADLLEKAGFHVCHEHHAGLPITHPNDYVTLKPSEPK